MDGASGDGPGAAAQKLAEEGGQRRHLGRGGRSAEDHAVMVAGNGEDGTIVFAKGLVKLVVVVLRLAKVVDHVAEMKEEGGTSGTSRLHGGGHGVGDGGLFGQGSCRILPG